MPFVQRANVILEVPEVRVQYYLESGYSVIDEKGNVIKKPVIKDMASLQREYVIAEKRIAELEQEVKILKEKLAYKENNKIVEEPAEPKKKTRSKKD